MHYCSEKWLHHQTNLLYMEWENDPGFQMYTHALIVEVMIAIDPAPLNEILPHIMNDLENLLQAGIFMYFLWSASE